MLLRTGHRQKENIFSRLQIRTNLTKRKTFPQNIIAFEVKAWQYKPNLNEFCKFPKSDIQNKKREYEEEIMAENFGSQNQIMTRLRIYHVPDDFEKL